MKAVTVLTFLSLTAFVSASVPDIIGVEPEIISETDETDENPVKAWLPNSATGVMGAMGAINEKMNNSRTATIEEKCYATSIGQHQFPFEFCGRDHLNAYCCASGSKCVSFDNNASFLCSTVHTMSETLDSNGTAHRESVAAPHSLKESIESLFGKKGVESIMKPFGDLLNLFGKGPRRESGDEIPFIPPRARPPQTPLDQRFLPKFRKIPVEEAGFGGMPPMMPPPMLDRPNRVAFARGLPPWMLRNMNHGGLPPWAVDRPPPPPGFEEGMRAAKQHWRPMPEGGMVLPVARPGWPPVPRWMAGAPGRWTPERPRFRKVRSLPVFRPFPEPGVGAGHGMGQLGGGDGPPPRPLSPLSKFQQKYGRRFREAEKEHAERQQRMREAKLRAEMMLKREAVLEQDEMAKEVERRREIDEQIERERVAAIRGDDVPAKPAVEGPVEVLKELLHDPNLSVRLVE